MGAPFGNDFRVKVKDPKKRKEIYKDFCNHLSQGYSHRSWGYDDGEVAICYDTMISYINKYDDLPSIHKKIAQSQGAKKWETICHDSAKGINEKANTASLQMVMRNVCGWDKKEDVVEKSKLSELTDNDVSQTD